MLYSSMPETPPVSPPPPPRPLKEIALDILHFPLNKPADTPFDSSMRISGPDVPNFENHLQLKIDEAPRTIESHGQTSVPERLFSPVPKEPKPLPESADLTIAHSVVPMERLQDALMEMANTNTLGERGVQTVRANAWPLATTMARSEEDGAALMRGSTSEEADRGIAKMIADRDGKPFDEVLARQRQESEQSARWFETSAHNLRTGVTPLFEELAAALGTSLSKGPHVS